ncbi:hypothetical protein AB4874_13975 [Thioclava sp. 15-R06ZXC-3]|uniref:Uncharacterized protein n=1 Tax=Thioclava arctica TaxID=3238301 RepID=A0ABV3TMD1_9RHOB
MLRAAWQAQAAQRAGLAPAMLRAAGLAITPEVVLADELREGLLASAPFDLEIVEAFYAVTLSRRFPNAIVNELLEHARSLHAPAPLV